MLTQGYSPQSVLENYQNTAQQLGNNSIFDQTQENSQLTQPQTWMIGIQNSPYLSNQWQQEINQTNLLQQMGLYQNSFNPLGSILDLSV